MEQQIATNWNQSYRLLSAGVKPWTADMQCYFEDILCVGYLYLEQPYSKKIYPAWSLSALLSLLPTPLTHNGRTNVFGLYHEENKDGGGWNCSYPGIHFIIENTPFEAVVNMIEWLNANDHSLNYGYE